MPLSSTFRTFLMQGLHAPSFPNTLSIFLEFILPIDHVVKDPLSKLLWLHTFGELKGLRERGALVT